MKMTMKRLFSMLLVLCLMLSILPVNAFANDTAVEQPVVQEEQNAQQEVQEEVKEEQTDSQTQEELTSEEEAAKTSEDVKTESSEEEQSNQEEPAEEISEEEPGTEGDTEEEPVVEEDAVTALFNTLMAFETYEELGDYMDNMSEEQYVLLDQFSEEQNAALTARIEELQENDVEVLASSVDHIDIACEDLTAYIGETPITFSFTPDDVKNGLVEVYINGTRYTSAAGYSTDNSGNSQVRIEGTFNVGTKTSPVDYTITIRKLVSTEEYGDVYVTLSISTNYWASNNVCPGKRGDQVSNDAGIDVKLGAGSAAYSQLNVSKVIAGLTFAEDKTFTFDIKNSSGEIVKTVTVEVKAGSTGGTAIVTGLAVGTYTVVERTDGTAVDGYELTVSYSNGGEASVVLGTPVNVTVTNTYEVNTIEISGSKTWNDNNDQDGKRPTEITINLLDGTDVVATKTVTEDDGWAWTFTDLPAEGHYSIQEVAVDGYTATYDGYNVTNTHEIEKTTVSGSKTWADADNQDGIRPATITVRLWADGVEIDHQEVTDGTWEFTDLPVYKAGAVGQKINYTITEDAVEGYTALVNGYNITNTHTPATVSVSGSKTWADGNNQDGIRPGSITIKLWNGNVEVDSKTVTADDDWKWTFTNLPKFAAGEEIKYTITEVSVEGYETVVEGFDVTNTHTPATTEVKVTKTWEDNNDQDGIRPESITVYLMNGNTEVATAILNEENKWEYTFVGLPKFAAGVEIKYTVSEVKVEGYETVIDGYDITNTHTPETIGISGSKIWDDDNDRDGIRPESITVNLLADDEVIDSAEVTAEDWAWSFTGLPKYRDGGVEIVYTVEEANVAKGYEATVSGYNITNTHEIEKTSVSGSKTWDDNNDQDGIRPESITVNLLADGEVIDSADVTAEDWAWSFTDLPKYRDGGVEIVYSVEEYEVAEGYTATVDGYNITNTHVPETIKIEGTKTWVDNNNQDGKRPTSITVNLLADDTEVKEATVTATTNWNWEFTDLPKYRDGGVEIIYTVTEDQVAEYTTKVDGYAITNTHEIEKTSISGTKIWDDNDNQDGKRPESITINLLADNVKVDSKVVSAEDGWAWTFDNLNKYNAGVEVKYSFTEEAVDEYTATYDGTEITNTHTPEETSVQVVKVWNDNNNQDGKRTNDVTIILVANSVETENTLVLNDSNGWKGTFTGLDKYENGEEIVYTVKEVLESEDYTSEITGSAAEGFTVTNTHEIEKINISGTKTWDDNNDQDGKRPDSITVNLLANGTEVDEVVVTPDADGDWVYSFVNLDKYAAGKEIAYTITEDAVDGYNTIYDGYNITNKYEPEKTSVTVIKAWEDANDQDGLRPDSIKVTLLADGEKIGMLGKSLTLSEKNEWRGTFTDLDKYKDHGTEIVYTVVEEEVEGYEAVISGDASTAFVITNVHEPEVIELISGTKIWDDDNNRDGKRPESVTVNLLANGAVVETVTVTAADNWSYSFENLPKYEAGEEIVYTLAEETVEDYSTSYDGFDVVNSYTPGMTSIKVTKRWVDGHNADGIRPKSVTVYLYANGVEIAEMKLSKKNDWTGEFEDLYIYENGEKIEYTIKEKAVKGYNNTVTGNAKKGFIVTNTHNVIPKTGDESNLPKYIGLFGASASVMAVLMFLAKPKKGKYAR